MKIDTFIIKLNHWLTGYYKCQKAINIMLNKLNLFMKQKLFFLLLIALAINSQKTFAQDKIVHDAEYYILEAQNGEKWVQDDKSVDTKLAEFRKKNDGKSPNLKS